MSEPTRRFPSWAQSMLKTLRGTFQNPEFQKELREACLDPLMEGIMEKMFPYIWGFLIVFLGTFLLVLCVFILLLKTWWV